MVEHALPGTLYLLEQAEPLFGWASGVPVQSKIVPEQTHFEEREINAILDMGRSFARFIILLTVAASFIFFGWAMFLIIVSQGEARNLEKAREVIMNIVKGLLLGVCSYLVLNTAVTIFINASTVGEVVRFWEDSEFEGEFTLDSLLGRQYEQPGVVLMLDGEGNAIICKQVLDMEAREAGWKYGPLKVDDDKQGRPITISVCYK